MCDEAFATGKAFARTSILNDKIFHKAVKLLPIPFVSCIQSLHSVGLGE